MNDIHCVLTLTILDTDCTTIAQALKLLKDNFPGVGYTMDGHEWSIGEVDYVITDMSPSQDQSINQEHGL